MYTTLLIVQLVVIIFLFSFIYYFSCIKSKLKENFYKIDDFIKISSITNVEKDECIIHSIASSDMPKEMIQRCNQIKFNKNEYKSLISHNLIHRHNEGRICLSACLYTWEERRNILYDMLKFVSKTLKENSILWVLYYGGLMGWYRDRALLPWDTDLDILVDIDNCIELDFENDIYKVTLHPNRFDPILGRFIHKESQLYCDIFYWKKGRKKVKVSCIKPKPFLYIPLSDFYPIEAAKINGINIFIPHNPKINLNIRYGNDLQPTYVEK